MGENSERWPAGRHTSYIMLLVIVVYQGLEVVKTLWNAVEQWEFGVNGLEKSLGVWDLVSLR